jgi:hypothetical protein
VLSIDRDGQQGVQWTDTAGFIWAGDLAADNSGLPGCL